MKLTNSTELRQYVFDKQHQNIDMPDVKATIRVIQDWLDEQGYVIKKKAATDESTPWHADYKRVFENETYWEVFKGCLKEELGKGEREFKLLVREDGTFSIYPEKPEPRNQEWPNRTKSGNELLEKGTVSFKEVEDDDDLEEKLFNAIKEMSKQPLKLVPCEPTVIPFQKCPVCEGRGTVPDFKIYG